MAEGVDFVVAFFELTIERRRHFLANVRKPGLQTRVGLFPRIAPFFVEKFRQQHRHGRPSNSLMRRPSSPSAACTPVRKSLMMVSTALRSKQMCASALAMLPFSAS